MQGSAMISKQYTVKIDDISDEMIALGATILKDLSTDVNDGTITITDFNKRLTKLFSVIPRRMDNLSRYLAGSVEDIPDILRSEQELFDVLIGQQTVS